MPPDERRPLSRAALFIGALTLWRLVLHAFNGTDLFVDEAQYWLWGQNLDFGYYSKPPMIGWLLRAVTDLAGSDTAFWIRAPAPILHALTAALLMAIARRLYDARTAAWAGALYIALPIVSVGSALISTDTVMMPFFALALLMYLRLAAQPGPGAAALMGLALGAALLSKYAAIYFLPCAALAAALSPQARPAPRDLALAGAVALLVFAPNIWWNLAHDAATVRHTVDNANWQGGLHPGKAAEFLLSQAFVLGPAVFLALLWGFVRAARGRLEPPGRILTAFSAPILAIVTWQALMSRAYANWAAAAFAAGIILAAHLLRTRPRVALASQALNTALALALPLLLVFPAALTLPGGEPLLARYLGRSAVSRIVADEAERAGLTTIAAHNRDLLADLHHTLRGSGLTLHALPRTAHPANYYEQTFPLPAARAAPLLVVQRGAAPPCPQAEERRRWTPDTGAYRGKTLAIFIVPPDCSLSAP